MPRLAVALCIRGKISEAFYSIAVVCSSWSAVNLHTSQRDILTPLGQFLQSGVNAGNRMVARWGPPNSLKPIRGPLCFFGEVCWFSRCHWNYYHSPSGWRCCWSSYKPWGIHGWWKTHLLHVYCCIPGYSGLSIWSKNLVVRILEWIHAILLFVNPVPNVTYAYPLHQSICNA